jgi:hypothetical protein
MKFHKPLFAKIPAVCALLFLALPALAAKQTGWVLEKSTLTYHVVHPLHHVEGVSHAARGKAVCSNGECSFLIAVPVKSFASGDTNRDLHMLQITRGAQFPMVVVRTQVPEAALKSSTIHANLVIQFAGHTADFKQVPFHLTTHGDHMRVKGNIPATLTDFKIPAPELLFVPIKNQIPVSVNMIWREVK